MAFEQFIDSTEAILESLSQGIIRITDSGVVAYANESAHKMLGHSRSDVVGNFYGEILYAEDEKRFRSKLDTCPIQYVLNSGHGSHVSSEVFRTKTTGTLLVEYFCVPIFEGVKSVGAVISFSDITESFEARGLIAEARDLAISTAQTKTAFLNNMSHEIRTPLNGILGITNLLADSDLSEKQNEYVKMLKTSTDSLKDIVNDILDYSKIEAKSYRLDLSEFDLRALCEMTIRFFRSLIREKPIDLTYSISNDVEEFLIGDATKIQQILNNLVSNALKFTAKGDVSLKVSTLGNSDEYQLLRFEICDTGIGINEDVRAAIFQPFIQADSSTKRLFGGTGLGLAICKQFVELMGGEISMKSVAGQGSRFWFSLQFPKSKSEILGGDRAAPRRIERDIGIVISQGSAQNIRILVVDDNSINRVVTGEIIEQMGFTVDAVENGILAVRQAKTEKYDIILMDCQMPEMDGYEAARLIRRNSEDAPDIIAMTAGVSSTEKARCLENGMPGFLTKPFTKNELAAVINEFLPKQNGKPSLEKARQKIQTETMARFVEPEKLRNFTSIESNGKKGFVSKILTLFFDRSEELIIDLESAVRKRNFGVVQKIAHNLKGSSGNIGITRLFDMFCEVEIAAEKEDISVLERIVSEANIEFTNMKREFVSGENK